MPSRFQTGCIALLLSLFGASGFAQTTIEPTRANPALGTPVIADQTVTGIAGEPLKITLNAETKSPASVVEFILRDPPLHGQLGVIVSVPGDRSQATVTYQPVPGAPATDSFSFTARYRDPSGRNGLYARSATMTIQLNAAAPLIESPGSMTFGSIMLGEEVVRDVYLRNEGNAAYEQTLDLGGEHAQFHVVQPADGVIKVPRNGSAIVKIAYRPTRVGKLVHDVVFHDNPGGATRFEARSFVPFKLNLPTNAPIPFTFQETSRVRSVEIPLISSATKPVTLTIETPPRAEATVGKTITLLPGQPDARVTVFLPADDVRPFSGELTLRSDEYSQSVDLVAEPSPARLLVNTLGADREAIDFGTVQRNASAQRAFILQNVGGQITEVNATISAPFVLIPTSDATPATTFSIPAEGSYQGAIGLVGPENGGQFLETLRLETSAGQTIELGLKATVPVPEVVIPSAMAARLKASQQRTPEELNADTEIPLALQEMTVEEMAQLKSPGGFVAEEGYKRTISTYIPSITEANVEKIGTHSITLRWPMAGPGQVEYDIEMLAFATDAETGIIRSVWLPYPDVTYEIREDQVYATIRGLAPKISYEIRVVTLGQNGRSSVPVPLIPILTETPLDWTWIYVGLGALLLAVIGFFIYRLKLAHEDD